MLNNSNEVAFFWNLFALKIFKVYLYEMLETVRLVKHKLLDTINKINK